MGSYVGCFSRGRLTQKATAESPVIYMGSLAMPGQRKRGYNVLECGMGEGAPMASPRESKGSTKIAVPAPIEQKSQRTRNSTRPPPAPKNGREFDAQVFLDTIGEGRKALLFPKKQTIFAPLASKYSVDVVILDYCMQ